MNSVIILGGGEGSRLAPFLGHGCKMLAPFNDRPWVERAVQLIQAADSAIALVVNLNAEYEELFRQAQIRGRYTLHLEAVRTGVGCPLLAGAAAASDDGSVALLLGDILFDDRFPVFLMSMFDRLANTPDLDWITVTRPPRSGNLDFDVVDFTRMPPAVVSAREVSEVAPGSEQVGGCLIIRRWIIRRDEDGLNAEPLGFRALHNFLFSRGYPGTTVSFNGCFEDFGTEDRYFGLTKNAHNL